MNPSVTLQFHSPENGQMAAVDCWPGDEAEEGRQLAEE